jgi:putative endopeptidase
VARDGRQTFEERTDCLVKQYESFVVGDNLHVDGKLTLGEDTADNGGLRLALMAFTAEAAAAHINLQQKTDGPTPLQQLFVWLEPELVIQHSSRVPSHARANGHAFSGPDPCQCCRDEYAGLRLQARPADVSSQDVTCRVW